MHATLILSNEGPKIRAFTYLSPRMDFQREISWAANQSLSTYPNASDPMCRADSVQTEKQETLF